MVADRKRDADLERELQSDLELEEEEQREHGVPPEEARHAALRAFGNPTLIREHTRAVWSWNALENLLRDLRISVRTLFRSPGFSMIAVLVMALCIGATTSLFTVVRSVLLRPLPFRDPDRLVMIYEHFRDPSMNAQEFNYNPVAPADYYDWRAQTHGFEDMAAWRYWQFNLTGEHGELPELVSAARRELEPVSAAGGERGHRTHIYRERRSSGRKRRDAYVESLRAAVRRGSVDCRQANPSRREAIHGGGRASQVVHLSRCEGAGLGSVCIGVAAGGPRSIMTITSAAWWLA